MFGRLLAALFWAAIFFALGAWSGGSLKPVGNAILRGAEALGHGAREAWNWAFYQDGSTAPHAVAATEAGHGVATVEHLNADATHANLAEARQAFADGDVKEAVAGYKAYLAANPADADAHGELGNVYYFNGQVGEAARAYYAASLYLLSEGRRDEAGALVPAIRIGAPALASELQNRIDASAAAAAAAQAEAGHAPAPTADTGAISARSDTLAITVAPLAHAGNGADATPSHAPATH
jgi:tetratricopeptide (TPR) repeat protein